MTRALSGCLGGVVPPMATPLTPDRQLDVESLLRLRGRLIAAGVAGLFALGSTGEASYLTNTDRHRVVEALAAEKTEEALLVGIVETTAARVIEALRALPLDRVDALVITGPFYASASPSEIIRHFEAIAAQTAVPLLAYNIPSNVGYTLPVDVTRRLILDGTIVGLKDSSPDLAGLRALAEDSEIPPASALFTGSDGLLDCALQIGANGAVAGLSNVAPELFVQAMRAQQAGNFEALAVAQHRIGILTRLYAPTQAGMGTNATQLGAIKTALRLQQVISTDTLSAPMTAGNPAREEHVHRVLLEAGAHRVPIHGTAPASTKEHLR